MAVRLAVSVARGRIFMGRLERFYIGKRFDVKVPLSKFLY